MQPKDHGFRNDLYVQVIVNDGYTAYRTESDVTNNVKGMYNLALVNEGTADVFWSTNGNYDSGCLRVGQPSQAVIYENRPWGALWFRSSQSINVQVQGWAHP